MLTTKILDKSLSTEVIFKTINFNGASFEVEVPLGGNVDTEESNDGISYTALTVTNQETLVDVTTIINSGTYLAILNSNTNFVRFTVSLAGTEDGYVRSTLFDSTGSIVEVATDQSSRMNDAINPLNEMVTLEMTPVFQYNFRYNNNNRVFTSKGTAGGNVSNVSKHARVFSENSTTNYGVLTSVVPLHYRNGSQAIMRCTCANISSPDPTASQDSFNVWGLMDRSNAPSATTIPRNMIVFGHNDNDGMFIGIKYDDDTTSTFSTAFVPQASWNKLSNLQMTLDPTKYNIYEIRYIFLGYLGVQFCIYDTVVNKIVIVHEYIHSNANVASFTDNSILSFGICSQNDASSTSDGDLRCHSVLLGVLGKNINNYPLRSFNVNSVVADGDDAIVLQCVDTYVSLDNYARFFLKSFNASVNNSGGGTQSSIQIYKNCDYVNGAAVAPTYTSLDANNSIIRYATGANVGSPDSLGPMVYSLSIDRNNNLSIENLNNIYCEPGSTLTFRIQNTGGSSATVDLSLLFEEDF